MVDVPAIPKAELHCHCDGILDPAMLRGFAAQGLDVEPVATALEALGPMTSVERWAAEYQPLSAGFLNPLTERLRLVAMAQRSRWRAQNVQYAELFVSGMLGRHRRSRSATRMVSSPRARSERAGWHAPGESRCLPVADESRSPRRPNRGSRACRRHRRGRHRGR
jgi:hypothetical protein